jgi:hypothetical protein
MKKFLITLKIFLVGFMILAIQPSCTKLDEEVYSDLTAEKFFENPDNLIYAFGVAYTKLYSLVGHKFGMIGMECGTDILVVPQRGGDWYDGGEWHRWHRHEWQATEGYLSHWWNNIFNGVSTCNRLIKEFESLKDVDVSPAIAELRGLRALYYYWLIDIFGNVPIQSSFDDPSGGKPPTKTRGEVYDFIISELNEILPDLSKETGLQYYGRVNYYVAQTILAKMYLNSGVYLGPGNEEWEKAAAACDSVILAQKYSLSADFFANFQSNATSSPEHIMGVPFDQVYAPQFEIHVFTLHYNLVEKFGILNSSWNGICFQEGFFNSFEEADVRRNGLLFGPQLDAEGNPIEDPSYEKFDPQDPTKPKDPDGAPLNLTPFVNMLEPNCLRQCGARVAKFPYIAGSDRYTGNDFPIFRYADVLLMKAEALLQLGNAGEALELVNQVRGRAGVEPFTSLDFENLLAERGRELYAEGHRRSDMIRFGVYLEPRWEKTNASPSYVTLWPIPQSQIDANENLIQNDGY